MEGEESAHECDLSFEHGRYVLALVLPDPKLNHLRSTCPRCGKTRRLFLSLTDVGGVIGLIGLGVPIKTILYTRVPDDVTL